MREVLDRELASISEKFLTMASMVKEMVKLANAALVEADIEKAKTAMAMDAEVDGLEARIDDEAIATIARHQPVAGDLRFLVSILKAVTDLERAGDYAAHVAEDAIVLAKEPPLKRYVLLPRMAERTAMMIEGVAKAVAEHDVEAARGVLVADDEVDDSYEQITRELITYMLEDPRTISKALVLLRVARSYERLGDHLENIAERVIFWITGETPNR